MDGRDDNTPNTKDKLGPRDLNSNFNENHLRCTKTSTDEGCASLLETEADELMENSLPSPLSAKPSLDSVRPAVIVYALFAILSVIYWNYPNYDFLAVSKYSIYHNHEYYRLITSLFVHGDMIHLLSNGPLFLIFGWLLRHYFGLKIFPVLTLAIGVGTNLITITFMGDNVRLIGASGMVYGMVALWLIFYIRFETKYTIFIRVFRVIAFILIMLFPTTFQPNVSYLAHTVGFLLGVFAAMILIPTIKLDDIC